MAIRIEGYRCPHCDEYLGTTKDLDSVLEPTVGYECEECNEVYDTEEEAEECEEQDRE